MGSGTWRAGEAIELPNDGVWLPVIDGDSAAASAPTESGPNVVTLARSSAGWTVDEALSVQSLPFYYAPLLALSGDTLIALPSSEGQPQAHFFFRTDAGWQEEALLSSNFAFALSSPVAVLTNVVEIGGPNLPSFYVRANDEWVLGETLEIGASKVAIDGDTLALASTSVKVLRASGASWVEEADLPAPAGYDGWGATLAIEQDLLVVGSPDSYRLDGSGERLGLVALFRWSGDEWALEAELSPPEKDIHFGNFLSVSGGRVLVAAENGTRGYLYEREAGTWGEPTVLEPGDGCTGRGVISGSHVLFEGEGQLCVFELVEEPGPASASDGCSCRASASEASQLGLVVALASAVVTAVRRRSCRADGSGRARF